VLVRLILAIPILIVASLLSGHGDPSQYHTFGNWDFKEGSNAAAGAAGVGAGLAIATALMILFRQKYPRWWFNWNLELTRFSRGSVPTCCCCATSTRRPMSSRR